MAQLTRHRLMSVCCESQRYCRYDLTNGDDWCVIPPEIEANPEARELFLEGERKDALDYMALLEMGIKPEDARYKLPNSMKTNLVVTMNVRELFHIFDMRAASSAQWEIRSLVVEMYKTLKNHNQEWSEVLDLYQLNNRDSRWE